MSERSDDIEALARMAARLAGRDPDEHLTMQLGDIVPFDGPIWSYPDFLARGEAAYHALTTPSLAPPPSITRASREHGSKARTGQATNGSNVSLPKRPSSIPFAN